MVSLITILTIWKYLPQLTIFYIFLALMLQLDISKIILGIAIFLDAIAWIPTE